MRNKSIIEDAEAKARAQAELFSNLIQFPYFAENVLKIKAKTGHVIPFKLNKAQLVLHEKLEEQLRRRGKVRAIVIKGRQMGISTYTEARFYHKLWHTKKSLKAFIMTHSEAATENLFRLAKGFHENHHPTLLQPTLKASNSKELVFAHNNCSYELATAGSKGVGRGSTINLYHGSEVAFWTNGEDHVTASAQAVGDVLGTEMILESTAEGVGNHFYHETMAAIRGESDYEVIFLPWFWHDEYEALCPNGWNPGEEWLGYGRLHNLTWEQLYWAYLKNRSLANSIGASIDEPCWKFKQEYPATLSEAFQSSGESFIPAQHVAEARKKRLGQDRIVPTGKVILGIDPARSGSSGGQEHKPLGNAQRQGNGVAGNTKDSKKKTGDMVGIIDRQGRVMGGRVCMRLDPNGSLTYVAEKVAAIIRRVRPDLVNIDVGGLGAGLYDLLVDVHGFGDILNAVNFGSKPVDVSPTGDKMYANRRAEMYDHMRDWFMADHGPVQIPDDDGLQSDICGPQEGPGASWINASNVLIIEPKDKIKARLGASPDLGDAAALTFAIPAEYMRASSRDYNNAPLTRNSRTGY